MISVLMSVYNETINEICQSIESILSQTYTGFELIIVLDQPNYAEARAFLQKYAEQDKRVKILVNVENVLRFENQVKAPIRKERTVLLNFDGVCRIFL